MRFVCQLDYPNIPYPTHILSGDPERMKTSVRSSGCGLCSACMAVDALTDKCFPIEEAVALSMEAEANLRAGTDMTIFGPAFAKKFDLEYSNTSDLEKAIDHLRNGGQIIAHVGVPEGASIGLFTNGGHYILLTDVVDGQFCILDPSYRPDKFDIPERVGKVNCKHAPYLYCPVEIVDSEGKPGKIKYHLFSRKTD